MKRKVLVLLFVITLTIVTAIVVVLKYNSNYTGDKKTQLTYVEKCSFKEIDTDWIYSMCIDYKKNDSDKKITNVYFDGLNMKYTNLPNHYVAYIDSYTNEIIEKVPTNFVSLGNGEKTREEVDEINIFFNSQLFNKEINMDDLINLHISNVDKSVLVDMYNEAYNLDEKDAGKYISKSFMGAVSSDYSSNYKYTITYIIDYGYVSNLNIELVYTDGTHLSDLIRSGNATNEEIKLQNKFNEIEKEIIDNNDFLCGLQKNKIGNFDLSNLNDLLNDLENK